MIKVAAEAGFCPGVRRADSSVMRLIDSKTDNDRIYTLGKLIHNDIYNSELARRGASVIDLYKLREGLKDLTDKSVYVLIRTHGITIEEWRELDRLREEYPNLTIEDMTCPFVKRIHKIAEENTGEDTCFILFGHKTHPETIGILSYAKGEKHVISSTEELETIKIGTKLPILVAQTTQNLYEFKKIKKFLKKLYTNAKIFDTICSVTENRQNEAVRLAKESDAMIVIGGRESSNTAKLYKLCHDECKNTVWIESSKDLLTDFPDNAKSVGITAGASTPDGIILEVLKKMEERNNDFGQMLEESIKTLHTGETVTGTVFSVNDTEIKLDLGAKFTGVLTKEQVTDDTSVKLSEMFKVGDEIEVFVIRVEDTKGIATVSKKRVDKDNSWVVLKAAFDNNEVIEGKVVSVVKGGVVVAYANNTVFVPASQTGVDRQSVV